ncbi:MAG: OB-fold putative lipoprotein [Spirochaetaceae bacterium]|jgi:hypothetical protein|nr:OB-fold putative lipoprotein [Spirochaetaceae bacterium]
MNLKVKKISGAALPVFCFLSAVLFLCTTAGCSTTARSITEITITSYGKDKPDKPKKDDVKPVAIEQFIKDFKSNKLRAEEMYLGKIIVITGTVKSVERSAIRKRPRVTFAKDSVPIAGVVLTDIDCYFPEGAVEQLKGLDAGKKVTIRGFCKDSDTFTDCEIVK